MGLEKSMANLNNRQRLALSVLNWHGGGGTATYALGSHWFVNKRVGENVGYACVRELELSRHWVRLNYSDTCKNYKELTGIIAKVERQQVKDNNNVSTVP
jgi:hypothetical protein